MNNVIFDSLHMHDDDMYEVEQILKRSEIAFEVVALCEVSRWDGKYYHVVGFGGKDGKSDDLSCVVRPMMRGHSYVTVEIIDKDVVMTEVHHDGVNRYIFRKLRQNCSMWSLTNYVRAKQEAIKSLNDLYNFAKTRTSPLKDEIIATLQEGVSIFDFKSRLIVKFLLNQ